jgi:hypothetical protein
MLLLGVILIGSFARVSIIGMFLGPIVRSLYGLFTGGIA